MTVDPGYAIAVVDGLVFALGAEWERLSARDPGISRARVRDALARLRELGLRPSFGDGELPQLPGAGAADVAVLVEQLERIRAIAPSVLTAGADTFSRILCADPWPRIYTTAVLDTPATSPVHVLQISDLAGSEQWGRVGQLSKLAEVQLVSMFGAPLGREPWPFASDAFPELRALDISGSRLRALPAALEGAKQLEALELADNPIDPGSIGLLATLPRLRYLGLRDTRLLRSELPPLPSDCEIAL
ncbi:MAG TPA: leucine-rich repeat domain-containing protein [Kofleriaceae bacterium]|nr:leucine-rich repeat domain-containing protein [Kofleriaceae bacterium]